MTGHRRSSRQDRQFTLAFNLHRYYADVAVGLCGLAARGLWIELLRIMWAADEVPDDPANGRGYLKQHGTKLGSKDLAKLVRADEPDVQRCLAELQHWGVFSRAADGTIYCRSMVEEAELRRTRQRAGAMGGRARAAQAKAKQKSKQIQAPTDVETDEETEHGNSAVAALPVQQLLAETTSQNIQAFQQARVVAQIMLDLGRFGQERIMAVIREHPGEFTRYAYVSTILNSQAARARGDSNFARRVRQIASQK